MTVLEEKYLKLEAVLSTELSLSFSDCRMDAIGTLTHAIGPKCAIVDSRVILHLQCTVSGWLQGMVLCWMAVGVCVSQRKASEAVLDSFWVGPASGALV